MKHYLYILVLILCFGCKKTSETKIDSKKSKKDSIGSTTDKWKNIKIGPNEVDVYDSFLKDSIYKWFKPKE